MTVILKLPQESTLQFSPPLSQTQLFIFLKLDFAKNEMKVQMTQFSATLKVE